MNKREIKNLVNRLSDLIDKCENDFEAMVFNPDATFDLLLDSHSALYRLLYGDGIKENPITSDTKLKKPTEIKLGQMYYMPVFVTELTFETGGYVNMTIELPNGEKMEAIPEYFLNKGLIEYAE
ncbi:hypothetical protein BBG10_05630 [Streptococcus dysgalactiae subsp. equisimilis]|uniref:hypothetical protein n=1 Tax=Streptococcus dysgalactiae TaxID=1334 RepID=UPI0008252BFE|nr:hypothetical protein [Streptococcus dysgalactiae]OCX02239.1 hypothetical protein BBG10_05630 [Streptococcus dysgalactiae subsp. equisimilis]